MKDLWWARLHMVWVHYGPIGAMGVLLCVLAPAMLWWGADPERDITEALKQQRIQQRERAQAANSMGTTAQDPVATFQAGLPSAAEAIHTVKSLHALAKKHSLQVAAGDYKLNAEGATPWQRYQINLPVVGPYTAVKAWAAEALNTHSTLALEDWQTSREKVDQNTVQARLRWTLYVAAMPPVAKIPGAAHAGARLASQTPGEQGLFATLSWQPPPPPPVPAMAPPPPKAPPLPFRYIGRLEEDGRIAVFLQDSGPAHPRVVRQGDQWGTYRVDEITSEGMRLTYLPLNEPQRLLFGSAP